MREEEKKETLGHLAKAKHSTVLRQTLGQVYLLGESASERTLSPQCKVALEDVNVWIGNLPNS